MITKTDKKKKNPIKETNVGQNYERNRYMCVGERTVVSGNFHGLLVPLAIILLLPD